MLTHREAIPTLTSPAAGGVLVALLLPAVQSAREAARRGPVRQQPQADRPGDAQLPLREQRLPRPAITRQGRQAALELAGGDLALHRAAGALQQVQARRAVGQPAQQGALEGDAADLRVPEPSQGRAVHDDLPGVRGQRALFEKDKDTGIADVTDGTSNTLMVVEAKEAVPWTKPDDLSFDPAAAPSLFGAGSTHPGGFNASMADGSVRFFKNTIDLNVFRALITRAGGEVVNQGF